MAEEAHITYFLTIFDISSKVEIRASTQNATRFERFDNTIYLCFWFVEMLENFASNNCIKGVLFDSQFTDMKESAFFEIVLTITNDTFAYVAAIHVKTIV